MTTYLFHIIDIYKIVNIFVHFTSKKADGNNFFQITIMLVISKIQAKIIFQLVMKSHQASSGGDKKDFRFFHQTINYEYVKEFMRVFCLFYVFFVA